MHLLITCCATVLLGNLSSDKKPKFQALSLETITIITTTIITIITIITTTIITIIIIIITIAIMNVLSQADKSLSPMTDSLMAGMVCSNVLVMVGP